MQCIVDLSFIHCVNLSLQRVCTATVMKFQLSLLLLCCLRVLCARGGGSRHRALRAKGGACGVRQRAFVQLPSRAPATFASASACSLRLGVGPSGATDCSDAVGFSGLESGCAGS